MRRAGFSIRNLELRAEAASSLRLRKKTRASRILRDYTYTEDASRRNLELEILTAREKKKKNLSSSRIHTYIRFLASE